MTDVIDDGFRASVGRLLADAEALRSSVLLAHSRAWDEMTVRRLIREMDDRDLFRLLVATSPMMRPPGSEVDVWLYDLVQREERRRESRIDNAEAGHAA